MVVDLWGRCGTCGRWFDCDGLLDHGLPEAACPSCGDDPSLVLNFAGRMGARVVLAENSTADLSPR